MVTTSLHLREELPTNIVKWANLEVTMNDLFNNFRAWEERNAELINKFFEQPYFSWEESLIDKLVEREPNIQFDDIKHEWINLAILQYDNWLFDFRDCLNRITNDGIKRAFMQEIHDKVRNEIWLLPPYDHFSDPTECAVPWDTNVLWYFQKVVDYLKSKEWAGGSAKKAIEILKNVIITNDDLNTQLPAFWGIPIPAWVNLTDVAIPEDTKKAFDTLLSFEIWKEANRTIDISQDISNKLEWLFTNALPAINTVVWENEDYKYKEEILWDEYKWKLQTIKDDTNLSEDEKNKRMEDLRREYYLKYLKRKNGQIGNALEQLYNNNFDYSKLEDSVLEPYLDKVADLRLKMLFDNGVSDALKLNFGNLDQFSDFYKWLAKRSINQIPLDPSRWISIPVEKKITEWENARLKDDINQFWEKAKAYDTLPITYKIKKSDINTLPIDLEDKTKLLNFLSRFKTDDENYIIDGWNVWILIYLFFIVNSSFPITKFNLDKQKDIENLFWKSKSQNENWWWEDSSKWEWSGDWTWADTEGAEDFTAEQFIDEIEKYWPWKFENWSEIWLPMWNSELPGWWYQWMKVKISAINLSKWTFKWKVFWWELKFKWNLEWKSKEFKMNKEFFDKLKNLSKDSNKIWLQPNPDASEFNTFLNSLNKKLWTSSLSFPVEWVTWDGSKFMQKITDEKWNEKEVEVKYFWASSDDKSTYKIEYNPIRRSFTVSSTFNWEEKDKDWKSSKKRFSYKRDMDWNNFLIFFTQKWLVPQTEEEANDAVQRQDQEFKMVNGWQRKLNWFSFNNIKNWLKDIFWTLKKLVDQYDKSQTEKFKGIVESPILDTLAKLPLPPSVKYAIWERQQEIYNERDNAVWKKIEYYLKIFQADPDFWTTFDQLPPHAKTQWWKSLQMIVTDRVKNAKDRMWDPGLYQAAALLLANFEKWGSPYRWLSAEENTWLWVKALLWKAHYEQFLRDKAACIRDRDLAERTKESWLDKKWLNEALARCEMDYIINNIRWAYWKLPYFGSHESRWIPGKDWTNYIDNPSKRLLSDQFANKLESASKWWFTKSTVEDSYSKNKSINNFEVMEDEFWKMWSSRYQKGAWALRRMFDLASDKSLKRRAKRHFLTYLLSWALDINCDPGLKKQVYGWAKPMSFVPWMLVKEAWVAENIAVLLDDATNWDFSRNVTKYFRRSGQLKSWPDFKWLQAEINRWLTDEKMDELDDYFSKLPTNDFQNVTDPKKKAILQKFKKSLIDEDVEEFDRWLLENPTIVNNWLLTSINVISDRLRIEDWEFKGSNSDDIANKKWFWVDIAKQVNSLTSKTNDTKIVNFVLDKYFTRFWINSKESRQWIYKRIKAAQHYKTKVNEWWWIYRPAHELEKENWEKILVPVWSITKKDVDKVLLYALEWNIRTRCNQLRWQSLPSELKEALDKFQDFFTKAFEEWTLDSDDVKNWAFKAWNLWENDILLLWWRDQYKRIKDKDNDNTSDEWNDINDWNSLKPSKKREYLRAIFKNDDKYMNQDMENIYNTLKRNRNSLNSNWTLSIYDDRESRILDLQRNLAS